MKAIITGLNGTLAPVLANRLRRSDVEVIRWDRSQVSPGDERAMAAFIADVAPAWICHLAMGHESWAQFLARYCEQQRIGFLFTSTAMVFDHEPDGPHHAGDERTAREVYGRYKIRCEDAIQAVSNSAIITRIGWQIGEGRGGNQMIEGLCRMMEKDGKIAASTRWIPATSFMADTCDVLLQLLRENQAGTYHLDSNAWCALNFCEIVHRLKAKMNSDWIVESQRNYTHDQRLLDKRITMRTLTERI